MDQSVFISSTNTRYSYRYVWVSTLDMSVYLHADGCGMTGPRLGMLRPGGHQTGDRGHRRLEHWAEVEHNSAVASPDRLHYNFTEVSKR